MNIQGSINSTISSVASAIGRVRGLKELKDIKEKGLPIKSIGNKGGDAGGAGGGSNPTPIGPTPQPTAYIDAEWYTKKPEIQPQITREFSIADNHLSDTVNSYTAQSSRILNHLYKIAGNTGARESENYTYMTPDEYKKYTTPESLNKLRDEDALYDMLQYWGLNTYGSK